MILKLINNVINTKTFPKSLKISRITPIKKNNDDPLDPGTYRPVNLISPLSKLIEKTWSIQILKHMNTNNMIKQNHQGGIKGRGSITTVMELYQKMTELKMNKKNNELMKNSRIYLTF